MARVWSGYLVVAAALVVVVAVNASADSPENPRFLLADRGPDGNRLVAQPLPLSSMHHAVVTIDSVPLWVVGYQTDEDASWYIQTDVGDLYRVTANSSGLHVVRVSGNRNPNEPLFLVPGNGATQWVPAPVGRRPVDYLKTSELDSGGPLEPLSDAQPAVSADGTWVVLSGPTSRYAHGILGDRIEGGTITGISRENSLREGALSARGESQLIVDLAPDVAEERGVVLYDLDHDGRDEIITILSDSLSGSRVVAFEFDGTVTAEGDPIGQGFRWRHLIGAGPLGPEGEPAVVAVRTPHIGGTLEYLSYTAKTGTTTATEQFESVRAARLVVSEGRYGYSSHSIGSRNLGDAVLANVDGGERVEVILPTQRRDVIVAVGRTIGGSDEVWRFELGARMATNLAVAQEWRVPKIGQASQEMRRAAMLVGTADGSLHVWW